MAHPGRVLCNKGRYTMAKKQTAKQLAAQKALAAQPQWPVITPQAGVTVPAVPTQWHLRILGLLIKAGIAGSTRKVLIAATGKQKGWAYTTGAPNKALPYAPTAEGVTPAGLVPAGWGSKTMAALGYVHCTRYNGSQVHYVASAAGVALFNATLAANPVANPNTTTNAS